MELNVLSFDMPNNMYNINTNNNAFEIEIDDVATSKTIPVGNYSVKTFMTQLNTLINNVSVSITYNEAQNTYTFTKNTDETSQIKVRCVSEYFPTFIFKFKVYAINLSVLHFINK